MTIIVDISHADGSIESRVFDAEQLTLGSDPNVDIAVPRARELEPEHLLIAPQDTGCWVSTAHDAHVEPLIAGTVLDNGMVPYDTEIDIGSISIRIKRVTGERESSLGWITIIGICGILAMALAWTWLRQRSEAIPTTSAVPPELFTETTVSCPEPARAAQLADEAIHDASAKQARYPFDAREGIAAVTLLRIAQSCYAAAKNPTAAEASRSVRGHLELRIDGHYKVARVLLRQSTETRDYARLSTDAQHVLAFVDHKQGPYRSWLILIQRHAESRREKAAEDNPL